MTDVGDPRVTWGRSGTSALPVVEDNLTIYCEQRDNPATQYMSGPSRFAALTHSLTPGHVSGDRDRG